MKIRQLGAALFHVDRPIDRQMQLSVVFRNLAKAPKILHGAAQITRICCVCISEQRATCRYTH
jgi:hypothetical protein